MVSTRVEAAVHELGQLTSYDLRLEYIHSLSKGIRARVVGEVLDRARARDYTERLRQELATGLARMAATESRPVNPWAPHF